VRYVPTDMMGACSICCRARKGGFIDAGPVDMICMDCTRAIVTAYLRAFAQGEEDEPQKAHVCLVCGEVFDSPKGLHGHFMGAHTGPKTP